MSRPRSRGTLGPPTLGPRHWDPRHWDPRHWDPRHWDPRHWDPRHWDPRHWDPRHKDPAATGPIGKALLLRVFLRSFGQHPALRGHDAAESGRPDRVLSVPRGSRAGRTPLRPPRRARRAMAGRLLRRQGGVAAGVRTDQPTPPGRRPRREPRPADRVPGPGVRAHRAPGQDCPGCLVMASRVVGNVALARGGQG